MANLRTLRTVAVYIPLLTGSLSMLGSGSIIYSIIARRETKLRDPQHRILLGMSIADMFYSLCKALTFVLYPSGLGVPAFGNWSTCAMQGFFTQFGYATGTYNLVLSLYYYLTIVKGMKQRDFAKCLEKFLHGSVIILHGGFAISGVAIGLFNATPAFCYIAPYPYGCTRTGTCTRFGSTFPILYEVFAQGWIQLAYVVIIYTNASIWWFVRQKERAMLKYSVTLEEKARTKHARKVFVQSMLYVGAFLLSWSWATVFHLIGWIGGVQAFWPVLLINTFLPLQGFWNAFIYARPRYQRIKSREGTLTARQTLKLVFLPDRGTLRDSAAATSGVSGIERTSRMEAESRAFATQHTSTTQHLSNVAETDHTENRGETDENGYTSGGVDSKSQDEASSVSQDETGDQQDNDFESGVKAQDNNNSETQSTTNNESTDVMVHTPTRTSHASNDEADTLISRLESGEEQVNVVDSMTKEDVP